MSDHREAIAEVIDAEWTRPEHGCGGDDAACQRTCPVPAYLRMGLDELRDAAVTALLASDVLAQIRAEARAEALREFVEWVAINRAYNGSEHKRAQSLYNECLNAVLPTWAAEFAAEGSV